MAKRKPKPDHELFDGSDVTIEILPSKRRNQVDIRLKSDDDLNLLRIYSAVCSLKDKIESELNIMEEAAGEH